MAGHSRWANIKRKKGAADAIRGKVFTKVLREVSVAAKMGGGIPENNPRLRMAILAAKAENVSGDTIDRCIKKATGELEGVNYEEYSYEGYGAGGVAIIADCLTDNKQRTAPEIRHCFGKNHGNLGEVGCVSWNFEQKGVIVIKSSAATEDAMMELALDAGAEDVKTETDVYEIITAMSDVEQVKIALEAKKLHIESASVLKLPKTFVDITTLEDAEKVIDLISAMEDLDDVQKVYSNANIPAELLARVSES